MAPDEEHEHNKAVVMTTSKYMQISLKLEKKIQQPYTSNKLISTVLDYQDKRNKYKQSKLDLYTQLVTIYFYCTQNLDLG